MAAKSKFEPFKMEIKSFLDKGASLRSTWKMINSSLPVEARMSYTAFFHFVKKNIQS
jgi:hypothetical protein